MKFEYLTDTSEKSLSPFFSPKMIGVMFDSLVVIGMAFFICWPWRRSLADFISQNTTPLAFFQMFTATLIIYSYIHIRCGRGEFSEGNAFYDQAVVTFEEENSFWRYALIEHLLHVLFLFLPVIPCLMLVTSVSGLPLLTFLKACSVVLTTLLLCRFLAFLFYLLWGRASLVGYLLARIFLVFMLIGTIGFFPSINPILLLYDFNKNVENLGLSITISSSPHSIISTSYSEYLITIGTLLVAIAVVSEVLLRKRRIKNA